MNRKTEINITALLGKMAVSSIRILRFCSETAESKNLYIED